MKKLLALLLSAVMVMSLGITGLADDDLADDLAAMGMFKGTDAGYELDRAPTRGEAAVMLVRLLGEEEDAMEDYAEGEISHPFTDVPEWAAPHVAYLYSEGLTKGISETLFGMNDICTADTYATFMLRTLRYDDSEGDFDFATAGDFASSMGIGQAWMYGDDFTRGSLVSVTSETLMAAMKDGDDTLLASLLAMGKVDSTAAAAFTDKEAIINEFNELGEDMSELPQSMDMSSIMNMTMSFMGEEMTITGIVSDIKMNIDPQTGDIELYSLSSMADPTTGETVEITQWLKEDVMYMQMGEDKIKTEAGTDDISALMQGTSAMEMVDMDIPFSAVYSAEKVVDGDAVTYKLVLSGEALMEQSLSIFDQMGMGGTDDSEDADDMMELLGVTSMDLGAMTMETTYVGGVMTALKFDMAMSMNMEGLGEMATSMDMDATVHSYGEMVEIEFPDFSEFKTLEEMEDMYETEVDDSDDQE